MMSLPNFEYGILKECDLLEAIEVVVLCYGEENREDAIEDISASIKKEKTCYDPTTFVVRHENKIVSLMQVTSVNIHPNTFSFSWLCVLPRFRGHKLEKNLILFSENHVGQAILKDKKGTFIAVATVNSRLYRPLGYKVSDMKTHSGFPYIYKYWIPETGSEIS